MEKTYAFERLPDTPYELNRQRLRYCVVVNGMRLQIEELHGHKVLRPEPVEIDQPANEQHIVRGLSLKDWRRAYGGR